MSESKHAPAPWALDGTGWICDESGAPVCLINAGLDDHGLSPQEQADARLICSAPEMLEGLKGIRANLVRLAWEENSLMIEGIDTLIAKAEGK